MQIGSVTSAPNVYGPRQAHRPEMVTPVRRIEGDFPDQDPLDHLTHADRALLAHLQAGVVDVDRAEGTAIAYLAKEIAYVRAAGILPPERPLTHNEISMLLQQALSYAVRPMAPETLTRMTSYLPKGRSTVRIDVLL